MTEATALSGTLAKSEADKAARAALRKAPNTQGRA